MNNNEGKDIDNCIKREDLYNEAINNDYLIDAFEEQKHKDYFGILTKCCCVYLSSLSETIETIKAILLGDDCIKDEETMDGRFYALLLYKNFKKNFDNEFVNNNKYLNNKYCDDLCKRIEDFYNCLINIKTIKKQNKKGNNANIGAIKKNLNLTKIYKKVKQILKNNPSDLSDLLDNLKVESYEMYLNSFQEKYIEDEYKLNSTNSIDAELKKKIFKHFVIEDNSGKIPYSFLSYAHQDRLYTLILFLKFDIVRNEKLYIDWFNHGIVDDGVKLKEDLFKAINNCKKFYLLRTPHVEITGKDSVPSNLRQWCSWEVGCYYSSHNKIKDIHLINTISNPKNSQFYEGYSSN